MIHNGPAMRERHPHLHRLDRRIASYAAALLILAIAPWAIAQEKTQPEPAATASAQVGASAPIVINPSHIFSYPGDTWIDWIDLTPDGKHLRAHWRLGSVNLWAVLVYFWPELLAFIAALMLVVMLCRVIRRKRIVGQWYCRKCNYQLANSVSDRCPECGATLTPRNRVIGRPPLWRLGLIGVLLMAIGAGYEYGRGHFPREGTVSKWFYWCSTRIYDWAYHHDQDWLLRHKTWITQIVEIDPQTGRIDRTVFSQRGGFFFKLQTAPDGRSMIGYGGDNELFRVDAETGSIVARIRCPEKYALQFSIGVGADGNTAYFTSEEGLLRAWDTQSGALRELLTIARGDSQTSTSVIFLDVHQPNRIGIRDETTRNVCRIRIWDEQVRSFVHGFESPVDGPTDLYTTILSPDAARVYVAPYKFPTIAVYDRQSGARLDTIDAGPKGVALVEISPDQRWLVAESMAQRRVIQVCDLRTRQWIGQLQTQGMQTMNLCFMPDNKTVAMLSWLNGVYCVRMYDLSPLREGFP